MGFFVVVGDQPTTDHQLAHVIHPIRRLNGAVLEDQSQVDRLERRAGFIEILNGPFPKPPCREIPVAVGVIGGCRCQHQQLTIGGIHHDCGALLGFPLGNLLSKSFERHLLEPGIQRQLQAQIIAIKGSRGEVGRQRRAVSAAAEISGLLMASQITITALFKSCLRLPLRIEKAHHVGEQCRLGIHPLGIGLQIQAANS